MADWKMGGASGIPAAVPAGDLGGTVGSPTVVSTHLTAPLPEAQGGTGQTTFAAALTASGATAVTVSASSGWTASLFSAAKALGVVTLSAKFTRASPGAWASITTLDAGFRPAVETMVPATMYNASGFYGARLTIATSGVVSLTYQDNGTALTNPEAIGEGFYVRVSCSFVVA